MRVLYLTERFPWLSETFVAQEAIALLRLGIDVRVISLVYPESANRLETSDLAGLEDRILYADKSGRAMLSEILIHAFRLIAQGKLSLLLRLLRGGPEWQGESRARLLLVSALMTQDGWSPDVIHCHFGGSGAYGAILKSAGFTKAALTTTFHGYDVTRILVEQPDAYKGLFQTGDYFLAVSSRFLTRIRLLGAPEAKSEIHHMGVDCDALPFRPRSLTPGETIRCLSVGRMTEKKGHGYTIRSVAGLIRSRPDLRIQLDVIGGGPRLQEMRDLVRDLGMESSVTVHGPQQPGFVREMLDAAHIFLLHSVTAADGDQEGIPVALMEAMALGLPVVSTRHSAIPELIEDGVSGLLVEERDEAANQEKLLFLIENPAFWPAVTKAARECVESQFNAKLQAQTMSRIFSKVATPTV